VKGFFAEVFYVCPDAGGWDDAEYAAYCHLCGELSKKTQFSFISTESSRFQEYSVLFFRLKPLQKLALKD
jgi:hypothetical protein